MRPPPGCHSESRLLPNSVRVAARFTFSVGLSSTRLFILRVALMLQLLPSSETVVTGQNKVVNATPANITGCTPDITSMVPMPPTLFDENVDPLAKLCFPPSDAIPVLGVSVVHDGRLFLSRLIRSIDYPVSHIVIAYNRHDHNVAREVHAIRRDFSLNITLIRFNRPQSCAEGWNAVMRAVPNATWYLLPNYDVYFPPGQLQKLAYAFPRSDAEQSTLYCLNGNFYGYSTFALKKELIDRVGVFDENIYPAYFEDFDWAVRIKRIQPPAKVVAYSNIYYIHGLVTDRKYNTGQSRLSLGPGTDQINRKVYRMNYEYAARAKWGCQDSASVDKCKFLKPFANKKLNVSYWVFDQAARDKRVHALYGLNRKEFMTKYGINATTPAWEVVSQVFDGVSHKKTQ